LKDKLWEQRFPKDVISEELPITKFVILSSNVIFVLELDNADGVKLLEPVCPIVLRENALILLFSIERSALKLS